MSTFLLFKFCFEFVATFLTFIFIFSISILHLGVLYFVFYVILPYNLFNGMPAWSSFCSNRVLDLIEHMALVAATE